MDEFYINKFKQLNKKNKNNCCKGECIINYISHNNTLICSKCRREKHIDYFLDSRRYYLCDKCDLDFY